MLSLALIAALAAAEPAAGGPQDDDKPVCVTKAKMGTRFKERLCVTKAEYERRQLEERQAVNRMQAVPHRYDEPQPPFR